MLRQEGWRVNRKRVHRLWRREGLRVPAKQHKRRRLGHSEHGIARRRAEHKDHVWCVDFIHGRDAAGAAAHVLRRIVGVVGNAVRARAGGVGSHPGMLLRSARRLRGTPRRPPIGAAVLPAADDDPAAGGAFAARDRRP
ncbi:MAG: hypothetical protein KIS87_04730 [Phycisphaeraceae bacterium]|nr:hypothetical protein [Phycisphaeraceae bacterium]